MTSIQQREQLQSQIWKIANEVRGAVDGWDFKQFVLGTLFYRFISKDCLPILIQPVQGLVIPLKTKTVD